MTKNPEYENGIHWVICGGETGIGARPMHPDWVRSLRDQCVAAGVPFFFKSWGDWLPCNQITDTDAEEGILCRNRFRVGKRRSGRLLDGREWSEIPEGSC